MSMVWIWMSLALFSTNWIFSAGHFDGKKHYGDFGSLYRPEGIMVNHVRECTSCPYQYPDCENIFWNIYNNLSSDWAMGHLPSVHPQPWDLSKNTLHVSCMKEDVMSGNRTDKRRRRRNSEMQNDPRSLKLSRHKINRRSRNAPSSLDPDALGVIYVNAAYFGKDFYKDCSTSKAYDYCLMNGFEAREFFVECNLEYECWLAGVPRWLSRCNKHSDFLHVEYQCIPDSIIYNMDFSTSLPQSSTSTGYIRSPEYPYNYKPKSSFECYLNVPGYDELVEYKIKVLDFHLENPLDNDCCGYDWLEFQSITSNTVVYRKRFCAFQKPGFLLTIKTKKMRIVFNSDEGVEERGFWIQYKATINNRATEVNPTVSCQYFDRYDVTIQPSLGSRLDDFYESEACNYYDDYMNNWETWSSTTEMGSTVTRTRNTITTTIPTTTTMKRTTTTMKSSSISIPDPTPNPSPTTRYSWTPYSTAPAKSTKRRSTIKAWTIVPSRTTSTTNELTTDSSMEVMAQGKPASALSSSTVGVIAGAIGGTVLVVILTGVGCLLGRRFLTSRATNKNPGNHNSGDKSKETRKISDPKNIKKAKNNNRKSTPNTYYTVEPSAPPPADRASKPIYNNTRPEDIYYTSGDTITSGYLEPRHLANDDNIYVSIPDEAVYEVLSSCNDQLGEGEQGPSGNIKPTKGYQQGILNPSYDKSIPIRLIRKDPPVDKYDNQPTEYVNMHGNNDTNRIKDKPIVKPKPNQIKQNVKLANQGDNQTYDYVDPTYSEDPNGPYTSMVTNVNKHSHVYQELNTK